MFSVDMIQNGFAEGQFGGALQSSGFDTGLWRPFRGDDNKIYCSIHTGTVTNKETGKKEPKYEAVLARDLVDNGYNVTNATLGLRLDDWRTLDRAVIDEVRQRATAFSDLMSTNSVGGFDAYTTLAYEHDVVDDVGEALVDMDGLSEGRNDQLRTQRRAIPLPIIHADFYLSDRQLAISRKGGLPLDTTQAEQAARRIAEYLEQVTIGTLTGYLGVNPNSRYDLANQIFGYANHPDRNTKADMTAPTSTNGTTILSEVLELIDLLQTDRHYGPYTMYVSTGYDQALKNDFKTNSDKTVRQRILEEDLITDIKRLDFLTGNVVILVQMTKNVARAINGMAPRTIMWETKGGMQKNFKVMAIQAPQLRSTFNNRMGVAHGTTA